MKLNGLLKFAKRAGLRLVQCEIARILAKPDKPKDVTLEATDDGVAVSGKNLKSRAVSDPAVRDIAR